MSAQTASNRLHASDKAAHARPRGLLRDAGAGLWLILLLSIVLNLLVLASPIYSLQLFDRVLPTRNLDTLIYLTAIVFGALLALGLFDAVRQIVLSTVANWWAECNRPLALDVALRASRDGAELGSDLFADMNAVRGFLSSPAVLPIFDAPWVPLFIAAIWLLHPAMGALALGAALVLFALAVIADIVSRGPSTQASQRQGQLDRAAGQFLRGADPIAAMGMHSTIAEQQRRLHSEQLAHAGRASARGAMVSGLSKAIRIIVQVAIMGLGAYLAVRNEMSSGGMIAGSIILGRALAPVEQMIGSWRTLIQAREANKRVMTVLRTPADWRSTVMLPEPRGKLEVRDLTYEPKGLGRPIVNAVSFAVEPGSVLAIMGASGSGKTTMCRLLVGALPPASGSVRVDGAEIKDWNPDQIGRAIGYVSQGFELFSGTVRDNVARFRPDATDEAVVAAATLAGCHEMISGLPLGYASLVGDGGRFLSAGQRQRVSFARALFGEPRLVVLDEANAFLDGEGEAALGRAILELRRRNCAVVLVTHRPALLGVADFVGLMRDGRIDALDKRDVILGKLGLLRGPMPAAPQGVPSQGAVA